MAKLSLLPGAKEDYRAAYAWYHDRGEHLAQSFEAAVDQALKQVANAPQRFAKYDKQHRCHLLRKFPYSIIYRSENEQVFVVAVAHGKRKPGYWQKRQN